MKDKHPLYQKIFYWACWVILAMLAVVVAYKLLKG